MKPSIVTIGVYGFDESGFFQAVVDAGIDTFCDIRLRRGMRGSMYAFVNSNYLQRKLSKLGIQYLHVKDLAPDQSIRDKQKREDEKLGVAKRTRSALGQAFIQAYETECLAHFDANKFIDIVGSKAKVIGLFCVERDPEACHRSLAAMKLANDLGFEVKHVKP